MAHATGRQEIDKRTGMEEADKRANQTGSIYEGAKPSLIVGNPVLLKDIMVRHSTFYNSGPWKRVRDLVRKTFKPRELNISCDADIPYDVFGQSDYLSAVIAETLRFYNPVLRMERKAVENYILHDQAGKEMLVEKDMVVGIPVWALHHSDEFYPRI
ncbi:hypothetical protein BV898_07049 [Hypsibius exemplaris]|uniref:Uncharacterized protein n=1 Tax=Hypsibius exemplaris TaxID=2072580 RepID=A0A1W0WUX2_HYPEX|nr:hypothetical protein BV898_07049 [Hypsibius exemplaris]